MCINYTNKWINQTIKLIKTWEASIMWKKPEINKPSFKKANLVEMSEQETIEVNGKGTGICIGLGLPCWSKGSGNGICIIFGSWL